MTRINTTTNHGVYTREKVSPLGNEEQAKATSLHGSGGSPDSRLFGTGKDATGHSAKPSSEKSKAFVDEVRRLLGRGEAGAWLLYSQLQAGRLPFKPEEMSSKEILDVAAVLEYDPFGVEIFKLLVLGENPKIDLGRLSAEDSHVFADKLLEQGLGGM
ncbi:MAG: hypothetical protein LBF49_02070, partial [Puniceicoccales bacterium]|nr:hypothetical protein [Puniceicoccales bacterium]